MTDIKNLPENPLLSVITPVRNSAKYLKICIESVLHQSYPNIEHIFVDGVSTDSTLEIIKSYAMEFPGRIRYISEPDKIAAEAWNKGLAMAKGDILGWLGADDTYEPDAAHSVVSFFQSHPEAFFVSGDCNLIDEGGKIIRKLKSKEFELQEAINDACYISTPAAFYRKELVEKVGLFDTTIHGCDLDYWIRAGQLFKMYRMETVLANFRTHSGSITGVKTADKMNALEGYKILRRYHGRFFSPRMLYYIVYSNPATSWIAPALKPVWRGLRKLARK